MARERFDMELDRLRKETLTLGELVGAALKVAENGFRASDALAARRVLDGDERIDERRLRIESDALTLIATQQPVAGDMRLVAAILDIAGELERMGDYATGIARTTQMAEGYSHPADVLETLDAMTEKALDMLRRSMTAFEAEDVAAARAIIPEDDEVDEAYRLVFRQVLAFANELPDTEADHKRLVEHANYLLWVAHNLERTADRVAHVCERIVFTVTGEVLALETA